MGVLIAATPSFIAEFGALGSSQLEIGSALVLLGLCDPRRDRSGRSQPRRRHHDRFRWSVLPFETSSSSMQVWALLVLLSCAGRTRLRRLSSLTCSGRCWPWWQSSFWSRSGGWSSPRPRANPNYLKDNHDCPTSRRGPVRISFSLGYESDFWAQMIGATGQQRSTADTGVGWRSCGRCWPEDSSSPACC